MLLILSMVAMLFLIRIGIPCNGLEIDEQLDFSKINLFLPSDCAIGSLGVQLGCNTHGIRVQFGDNIQCGVDLHDPCKICLFGVSR